jgi:hypothetical protein
VKILVRVSIPTSAVGLFEKVVEVDQDGECGSSIKVASAVVRTTNELLGTAGVKMGWNKEPEEKK